jgi:hypothetical protein
LVWFGTGHFADMPGAWDAGVDGVSVKKGLKELLQPADK